MADEKWRDTQENHRELFALLAEAELKYSQALIAATSTVPQYGEAAPIARHIFENALNSLTQFEYDEVSPLSVALHQPKHHTDPSLLAQPVLLAMCYCIDSQPSFSLDGYHLTSGSRLFDHIVVSWPETLLHDLGSKTRFVRDLIHLFSNQNVDELPLLSEPQARAVQLLVLGKHLIRNEQKRIGLPLHPRVILPS